MKPSQVKRLIANDIKAGLKRPVLIQSSPGLGKTEIAGQIAKELGIGFRVIHAPLMQPEDYGIPVVSADKTDVNFVVSSAKFPIVGSNCPDRGILLLDELRQCDPYSQKILANLALAREIHGKPLKPDWTIVATGNRQADRAGANRLLGHLADRLTIVELEPSIDDWTQWALTNGVSPIVISFLRFRPELMSHYDPQAEKSPTPRGWVHGVSQRLPNLEPDLEFAGIKGDVGEGAAAEFCGFLKIYRKLPNPDSILLNPTKADVPTDPATRYALVGALVHKTTATNFGRVMEYIGRLGPEFTVLFIRDVIHKAPEIQTTKEFIAWASGDGAKLLS